ncbi:hypothetical protein FHT40_002160 [Mycolicibacterium sp. BK556]|uniref:Imm61 family immunity protein n=1 Tax=Mycobacteriaceae TaxID=1762 RepID=UPI00105E5C5F|nr:MULTISPECIES: Imm61 family immunity protein [Mycobacteriaceae]MBB3602527.1 hypothetical protein [Mycolicibacterium sp. BK556]MBB3632279.1 hypothetical protein [Mycolicibacterium sp. BK607]MBB3750300.1 hypothetical protein [Mycolicibacterium sp. BK634]TDO18430.1 immunity protein 61 of polymorphic toxin system [Mycobacterium sp. BK086]
MTSAPRIGPELIEWAREGGFALTPDDGWGAALFWTDPGGETRLYLRTSESGITLTSADRGEAEVFVLSSPQREVVESYLWDFFGTNVRSKRRLPWLEVPTTNAQLAERFTIGRSGEGFAHLTEADGEQIAQARDGDVGVTDLVLLSHLVGRNIHAVRQTYESPDGRPFFPQ